MTIIGRPLYWFAIVMLVFLFWRAPQQMSAVLGGIGTAFVAIGDGIASFIAELTNTPR
jgi:ABC-type transport system involved in multi-copper enzyme maturation permease subunit